MNRKSLFRFLPLLLTAVVFCSLSVGARSNKVDKSSMAKSRYYYMQGAALLAQDKQAEAYEMFRRAESVCPEHQEARWMRTIAELGVKGNVFVSTEREADSLAEGLKGYVDKYPDDLYENHLYAGLRYHYSESPAETERIFRRMLERKPSYTDLHVELSSLLIRQGKLPEAIAELNAYEKAQGAPSEAVTLTKVNYYLSFNDTLGAINEVKRLVDTSPRNSTYLLLAGNLNFFIQRLDSAKAYFDRAIEVDPENGDVNMSIANYYAALGDTINYDKYIYATLIAEDYSVDDKIGLLAEYLQTLINENSDTERGDRLFEVLVNQYPHTPEVHNLASRYAAAKRDFAKAEEEMEYALNLAPDDPEKWYSMMTYQTVLGKTEALKATYKKSKEHVEPLMKSTELYAFTCFFNHDFNDAIDVFSEIIRKIEPELVDVTDTIPDKILYRIPGDKAISLSEYYVTIGECYGMMDSLNLAMKLYDNALLLYPDNTTALNDYAYNLAEENRELQKALTYAERATTLEPENPVFLDTYAWVLYKLGDYNEAKKYMEKTLACYSSDELLSHEILEHYGDILYSLGEKQEAVNYWQKALNLRPDNERLKMKVQRRSLQIDEQRDHKSD